MSKTKPYDLLKYIKSLSSFEETVSLSYQAIAEKTVDSTAKSHLLKISQDSIEHSKLLKGFLNWIIIPEQSFKPSQRKMAEAMNEITKLNEKTQAIKRINGFEFSNMFEKLLSLETFLSVEYQNLTQRNFSHTLEKLFLGMSSDEENHQTLLVTVNFVLCQNKAERTDNPPMVKYQNPAKWNRSIPSWTYNQS